PGGRAEPAGAAETAQPPTVAARALRGVRPVRAGDEATATTRRGTAHPTEQGGEAAAKATAIDKSGVAAHAAAAAPEAPTAVAAGAFFVGQPHPMDSRRPVLKGGPPAPRAAAPPANAAAALGEAAFQRQVLQRQGAQGQLAVQAAR